MAMSSGPHDRQLDTLFNFGLGYPGAHVKSPWPGHRDLAVKDKTFAYLSVPGEPLGVSCKLPSSCDDALRLPFTSPTEYGLGKSGWVSASFEPGDDVPVDMLKAWIDESYRAQAPKRLSASVPPLEPGLEPQLKAVGARKKTRAAGSRKKTGSSKRASSKAAPSKAAPRKATPRKTAKQSAPRSKQAAERTRQKVSAAKRG